MKKILLSSTLLLAGIYHAQVSIGGSSLSSTAVSLEFGVSNSTNGYRGIILPWVTSETEVSNAVNGTLIFDLATLKVKVKKSTGWFDLTVKNASDVIPGITNQTVDSSIQNSLSDLPNAKVQIGGNPNTDTTPGILVLADTSKAMILPKMASPHLNIKNPAAGMMAYDTTTNQLEVFNGTVWTFWKS